MGVKLRRKSGKWYLYINYHAQRKAKCIGSSRAVAEDVKRKVEAKLALGDLSIFSEKEATPTFGAYARNWQKVHADVHCKPSTAYGYDGILRLYLLPTFEQVLLNKITRDEIKELLGTWSANLSKNTVRNIARALNVILNHAVEDGLVASNPATKLGRFTKSDKAKGQAVALTKAEAATFLDSTKVICPEFYPLFLMALSCGLRRGELVALKWGDIQFGKDEKDSNRFIFVQRNYVLGKFTSPKSKKPRRVDLPFQLRAELLKLREERLLKAVMQDKASIADDLVFPSSTGTVLNPDNLFNRYFMPSVEHAGLRRFRLHDLRHTYGSLLIQDGASLAYVKEEMGHSSIQVTVDIYGHLIPGANIAWADRLEFKTSPQQNATPAQPETSEDESEEVEVIENYGDPGKIRTSDLRFRKPTLYPSELRGHLSYTAVQQ